MTIVLLVVRSDLEIRWAGLCKIGIGVRTVIFFRDNVEVDRFPSCKFHVKLCATDCKFLFWELGPRGQ